MISRAASRALISTLVQALVWYMTRVTLGPSGVTECEDIAMPLLLPLALLPLRKLQKVLFGQSEL